MTRFRINTIKNCIKATISCCLLFMIGSCQSEQESLHVNHSLISIDSLKMSNSKIEDIVAPYRDSLALEMNRIISFATGDFMRNRPEGALNNLVTDLTLEVFLPTLNNQNPSICIMNFGGLRSSINKGEITVEDVYKLMPFDNTIVILKTPMAVMDSIMDYFQVSGGEPISGVKISGEEYRFDGEYKSLDTLQIVTTNYLANGGDNMSFLKHFYSKKNTPVLLRDLLLDEIEKQDSIFPLLDNRIVL